MVAQERVDAVVVGAGVVGLAVARSLAEAGREVLVLEARDTFGTVTSSRNSEVIHAGIYYPQHSLKAGLCVAGRERLYAYCAERGIAHRMTGKLIVAADEAEIAVLERYHAQARANGAGELAWLDREELRAAEPAVRGLAALRSPRTGIVDSHGLMVALLGDLEARGGMLVCRTPVERVRILDGGFEVQVGGAAPMHIGCAILINAAGLDAQALAHACEGYAEALIPERHLARGRYYAYSGASPLRQLVYPVARAGGLGVHATLDLAGGLRFGPDLAWIDRVDHDFDDAARDDFIAAIRRWYPGLDEARLVPGYAGIRPKLAGPGMPDADFRIDGPEVHGIGSLVHLFGIESPGLTASLALADEVRRRVE